MTLLERPLQTATLVSAVRAAVESRRRQCQVRDELAARARAEEALGEVNWRLQALMQALPVGVSFSDDPTCQHITGNPTVLAQFEIASTENLSASAPADTDPGRRIRYFVEGRPLSDAELPLQRAVAENKVIPPMEMEVQLPSGRSWIAEVSAAPVRDAQGNIVGGVAVTVDVTNRKRVEDALRELTETLERQVAERTAVAEQRARDLRRLAAELSEAEHRERKRLAGLLHDDLQQLLLAVKLRLPVLVEGPQDQLEQHVAKIDELVGECLSSSRTLTRELSPPILQCGELAEVIQWLGRWFGDKHGLKVDVNAQGELPHVPEHLSVFLFQSMRELLFNVVKHSGRMEARVGLSSQDGYLAVQVEDDGGKFDAESVKLRLQRPEGFGLFHIQERLRALGGRLEIRNSSCGGACFRMIVPVAEGAESQPEHAGLQPVMMAASRARGSRAAGSAVRLVVVDDHAVVREGLVGLLNRQPDFEVVGEAGDGQEAVQQAEALRADAVVMDVDMPYVDGLEATRQIKQRLPDTAVVGLSLHEEEHIAQAMAKAGADACISKHAPAKDLVQAVRRACLRDADPT